VIAAVTLPITALSSVLGMNLIVNVETHWILLTITLAIMMAMSTALLGLGEAQGLVLAANVRVRRSRIADRRHELVSRRGPGQTTESAGGDHPRTT